MKIQPLGVVKGDVRKFCGDLCGRGCTHEEYNRTLGLAYAAEEAMPGWEAVVWENMGWYWRLERNTGDVTWNLTVKGDGRWECYSYGAGQQVWTIAYATPREAVQAAVNALTEQIKRATRDLHALTGKQL